jgi:hypothetical protein
MIRRIMMDHFIKKVLMDRKIVQALMAGDSFNQIAKTLHVGKRRIRAIHAKAKSLGYLNGKPLPPYPEAIFDYGENCRSGQKSEIEIFLESHIDWIKDRREAGWKSITVLEEIGQKKGGDIVKSSTFYRFLNKHGLGASERHRCRVKVVPEIISAPGEVLQLDWGKLLDYKDSKTGKKKTVWFLIGVMGFSRYISVRLVESFTTETTLENIESILQELGGAPKRIVSDNPKYFAQIASKYEPLLNPAFERFCDYYKILPELLPPRDPQKKGKFERAVPYIRRLFEAHGEWKSLKDG